MKIRVRLPPRVDHRSDDTFSDRFGFFLELGAMELDLFVGFTYRGMVRVYLGIFEVATDNPLSEGSTTVMRRHAAASLRRLCGQADARIRARGLWSARPEWQSDILTIQAWLRRLVNSLARQP